PIAAPQQLVTTTVGLPVLTLETEAPVTIDAGGTATWTLTVSNTGTRPATGYTPTLTVDGAPVELAGITPDLAPGEVVTLVGSLEVPLERTQSYTADTTLSWEDAAGNAYGPLALRHHTQVI